MILPIRYEAHAVASVGSEPGTCAGRYEDTWLENPDRFPISLSIPFGGPGFGSDLVLP
jgi:hypothetical protein